MVRKVNETCSPEGENGVGQLVCAQPFLKMVFMRWINRCKIQNYEDGEMVCKMILKIQHLSNKIKNKYNLC